MTSRPTRRRAWGLAVLATATMLNGCSEQGEDYCAALKEEQSTLTELADSAEKGGDVLTPTVASFERLRTAAPEELRDEWDTLLVAYRSLVDAVQEAEIDPAEYRPDDPPPGLSGEEAKQLAAVASKVASARVVEAANGIQQHAREVCDVEFTG